MRDRFLELFRKVGQSIREELEAVFGTRKAQEKLKKGAFGDLTVYIDKRAEEILLEKVKESGLVCSVLSEEIGFVSFGSRYPVIIADPIDGSLNAKRGVPYFAVSLALSDGDSTEDITVGYVINLANGDEFTAIKHQGAYLNGNRIRSTSKGFSMAVVEGLKMDTDPKMLEFFFRRFYRVRQMGSMALDICYLAKGAYDVLFSAVPSRIVDYAAGILILRESEGEMFGWKSFEPFVGKVNMEKSERFFAISNKNRIGDLLRVMEHIS